VLTSLSFTGVGTVMSLAAAGSTLYVGGDLGNIDLLPTRGLVVIPQ
jgi:hypothetical protein